MINELEEKKLRKAEYEAGFSEGEKHGIELNSIETARRMLQLQEFSLEKNCCDQQVCPLTK